MAYESGPDPQGTEGARTPKLSAIFSSVKMNFCAVQFNIASNVLATHIVTTDDIIILVFSYCKPVYNNISKKQYTLCLKNDTDVAGYIFNAHQPILIVFGR